MTALPGIGLRHEFSTARQRRIGVVSHRSGQRDLVVYDKQDPDTAAQTVTLTREESAALAELLAPDRIVERLSELQRQVVGLVAEQLPIPPNSPYAGRSLGDTQIRTRTGASVVAVVRSGHVYASPRPDFLFEAGDVVVVIGTADGTAAVAELLDKG